VYPKHADESQAMLCREGPDLPERLGAHGTIVFMPECDRLTYRKISTLVDDATREMSRVYRRQLDRGVKLYINNRLVEPFDPTYQMASARHNRLPELEGKEKSSRLIQRWTVNVPVSEGSEDVRPSVPPGQVQEVREELRELELKLEPADWRTFLRLADGESVATLAEEAGISAGTMRVQIHRRRQKLLQTAA